MLTPEDLRNPERKSGFDFVGKAGGFMSERPYFAQDQRVTPHWNGPARETGEEAAQDYCDRANTESLTIEDIRDPSRRSGFRYVHMIADSNRQSRTRRFEARIGAAKSSPGFWRGGARATAEEAAQDYCDHVNGQQVVTPARLSSAGHKGRRDPMDDPEVANALGVLRDARAQRQGRQGYVYCIGEEYDDYAVKVGYSTNPEARLAELQTGNPRRLVLLGSIEGTPEDERRLHAKYIKRNLLQEWFRPNGELLSEFNVKMPERIWKG